MESFCGVPCSSGDRAGFITLREVRMSALIVALSGLMIWTGTAQAGSDGLVSLEALRAAGMQRHWATELPLPPGEEAEAAYLVDEHLYVVSEYGSVAAFHAPTGLPLWARNLNQGRFRILPPSHLIVSDGVGPVVFVSARNVFVLDRMTGQPLAKFALPFAYGSSAVGDERMLYLGSADAHLYALRWDTAISNGRPIRIWRVRAGGPVRSRPAYDGQFLFFASGGGQVFSCTAFDKVRRWSHSTGGAILGDPILHESGVYVASADRSVYRLGLDRGDVIWQRRLPTPLEATPIIAGRTLYQDCGDAGLYALDIDSGEVMWNRPDAERLVVRKADQAVVLSDDGESLMVLDNNTGQLLRSLAVHDAKIVVSNPQGDAIYMVSHRNRLVCIRPVEVPYLTLEIIAQARARLMAHSDNPLPSPPARDRVLGNTHRDVLRSDSGVDPLAGN